MRTFPCHECLMKAICFMDLNCTDYRLFALIYPKLEVNELADLRKKLPNPELQEIYAQDHEYMEKFFRGEVVDYEDYNKLRMKTKTRLTPILKGKSL